MRALSASKAGIGPRLSRLTGARISVRKLARKSP
jgi:hypothetical protein